MSGEEGDHALWGSLERLRALEHVTVVEERFVRGGKVWTSAGVPRESIRG